MGEYGEGGSIVIGRAGTRRRIEVRTVMAWSEGCWKEMTLCDDVAVHLMGDMGFRMCYVCRHHDNVR
jgi:hypothetical protein